MCSRWNKNSSWVIKKVNGHFYVSSTNWQGEEEYVCNHINTWSALWKEKNAKFEKFLAKDPHLS
jgi:hypothetical protein